MSGPTKTPTLQPLQKSVWFELLDVAIHAPSPHNVQPWRVRIVNDAEAELFIDSTRTLPKEDVTGSFVICAMGMFVEALTIVASGKSYHLSYELVVHPDAVAAAILESQSPTLIPFARLRLQRTDPPRAPGDDEELFLKRRTSRLKLQPRKPSAQSLEALQRIGEGWPQHFSVAFDADKIERLLDLNTVALFEDLNSSEYHDEIVSWFRYTEKQSLRHNDGLDARCMNTSPVNYWIVANLPGMLLLPITRQLMGAVYRRQTGHVPALGYISGPFWKPADAIEAGRFLMRFWLETARHDLYIHPFGNLVTNRRVAQEVERELSTSDIWLIFKIGYSNVPPKSRRLPVEQVLVS